MKVYRGYEITKLTRCDWIITLNGEKVLNSKWCQKAESEYEKNAFTLKEAKARIDKAIG